MIPEPPEPLLMLPALDHLAIVVPRGARWRRKVGMLMAMVAILGITGLLALLSVGVVGSAAAIPAIVLILATAAVGLLFGAPILALVAWLGVELRDSSEVLRLGRSGVDMGGQHLPWEVVSALSADEVAVTATLKDGSTCSIGTELPPAAAWWLTAALLNLYEQASAESIDQDGLAALESALKQHPTPDPSARKAGVSSK